jgi:ABC-2 type transport system permease protein
VFGCGKICCQMPSSNSSYLEKCLSAYTKVESILKQYNLYVETGKIDFDYIRFHSSHIPLEKVKSKVDKKYVYGIGKDFEKIAFVLFSGLGITRYLLLYPIVLLVQYILSLGLSFIVSSITVYLRDLEHLIGIAIMLLFYATPIVYSLNTIDSGLVNILKLNPMAHIVEAYRSIFYYQMMPDLRMLGIIFAISLVLCIIGYKIFKKLEKRFAEEV